MDDNGLKKGIEAYTHEQAVLVRILRKHKKLTETKFDNIFGDQKINHKMYFHNIIPSAFFMGSLWQGEWSKWLHLLQIMVRIGMVKVSIENNIITYQLVKTT